MSRYAEFFASIKNGKIILLGDATPAHELLPNQITLTEKEYRLLRVVQSIEEAEALLKSVQWKIGELEKHNAVGVEPK